MSESASPAGDPPNNPRGHRPSSSGGSGAEILYKEKLSVAWWMWLLVLLTGTTTFLALAPINLWAAVAATAVAAVGTAVALVASTTSIVITGDYLQVGRARIERRFVGEAEAFRGDEVRLVRGPELDGRAFMNFRVSVGPVVRIRITDPVDPTPYWLTSTRHPERIVEMLSAG